MKRLGVFLAALMAPAAAMAQGRGLFDTPSGPLISVGWAGFMDMKLIGETVAALLLAILLGAVIGFHPTTRRTVDRLNEAELPKIFIMYAFIGAVIGVTVREFGMVIGVVVFGIGGLIRFRTDTGSTRDTGRLIVVTLAGLIAGLGLPHVAVITTAFTFILVYLFDSSPACRIKIERLPVGRLIECAEAYRGVLAGHGCEIIAEHKSFGKERLEYVFRLPRRSTRAHLHVLLCEVPLDVRGDLDWEVE